MFCLVIELSRGFMKLPLAGASPMQKPATRNTLNIKINHNGKLTFLIVAKIIV
jgi:hypothetical protein